MSSTSKREEDDQFVAAWRHWVDWGRHWEPEHEVEEIELEINGRRQVRRAASTRDGRGATAAREAKRSLVGERARLMFHLGSWLLEQRQRDKLATNRWCTCAPSGWLSGDTEAVVSVLRRSGRARRTAAQNLQSTPGMAAQEHSRPVRAQSAGLWGAVLLLRTIDPNADANEFDLGPAAPQTGPQSC